MQKGIFRFEDLTVYQRSLRFSLQIYSLTQTWPHEHLFGITDQLRRASLSISLNIAEGYSRSRKDFRHFLTLSRGSCYECVPLIQLAESLKLFSTINADMFYNELKEIAMMLSGLRSSLSNSTKLKTLSS
jgi:four helix bundle protein